MCPLRAGFFSKAFNANRASTLEEPGFGCEFQSRSGRGYVVHFCHLHDGPCLGASATAYVTSDIDWRSLASEVDAYIALKKSQNWR